VAFRPEVALELGEAADRRNDMAPLGQEVGKFAPQNAFVFKQDDFAHTRSLRIMRTFVAEQT
jgi:hypothetical protein